MENVNELVTLISNFGFPIFCVIVMFLYLEKERTDHKEESAKWIEAINNNTNVMQQILDRVKGN